MANSTLSNQTDTNDESNVQVKEGTFPSSVDLTTSRKSSLRNSGNTPISQPHKGKQRAVETPEPEDSLCSLTLEGAPQVKVVVSEKAKRLVEEMACEDLIGVQNPLFEVDEVIQLALCWMSDLSLQEEYLEEIDSQSSGHSSTFRETRSWAEFHERRAEQEIRLNAEEKLQHQQFAAKEKETVNDDSFQRQKTMNTAPESPPKYVTGFQSPTQNFLPLVENPNAASSSQFGDQQPQSSITIGGFDDPPKAKPISLPSCNHLITEVKAGKAPPAYHHTRLAYQGLQQVQGSQPLESGYSTMSMSNSRETFSTSSRQPLTAIPPIFMCPPHPLTVSNARPSQPHTPTTHQHFYGPVEAPSTRFDQHMPAPVQSRHATSIQPPQHWYPTAQAPMNRGIDDPGHLPIDPMTPSHPFPNNTQPTAPFRHHGPPINLITHLLDPSSLRRAPPPPPAPPPAPVQAPHPTNTRKRGPDRIDRYRASIAPEIESHIARSVEHLSDNGNETRASSSSSSSSSSPSSWSSGPGHFDTARGAKRMRGNGHGKDGTGQK